MIGKERKGRRAIDGHRINGRLSFINYSHIVFFIKSRP
jgi:hypothetical protein